VCGAWHNTPCDKGCLVLMGLLTARDDRRGPAYCRQLELMHITPGGRYELLMSSGRV
jgi:hypothetical protein